MSKIADLLIKHEGYRAKPYFDCCGKFFRECKCEKQGKLTAAHGRNLEAVGISVWESGVMLETDIRRATMAAECAFPWFKKLDEARQAVVISMIYQMGLDGFKGFKKTIVAIAARRYELAANEMLQSKWADQTPNRARELSLMMLTGQFPEER